MFFSSSAQRLERLRKERQNQIKCKNVQWKERTSSQSGSVIILKYLPYIKIKLCSNKL